MSSSIRYAIRAGILLAVVSSSGRAQVAGQRGLAIQEFPQPVAVMGRIVSLQGTPVADLPRVFIAVRATGSRLVSTEPGGSFTLVLPPGTYQLSVVGLPPGIVVTSMSYGDSVMDSNQLRVAVTMNGEMRIAVDTSRYDAAPGVKVRGTVVNIPEEFSDKVFWVRLLSRSGIPPLESWVRKDGSFEFGKVSPGRYEVSLVMPVTNPPRPEEPVTAIVVASEPLDNVRLDAHDNPFPEYPRGSYGAVFDGNQVRRLDGVITKAVTRLELRAPVYFFRMNVKDDATGSLRQWAVILTHSKGMPEGDPDLAKLGVGTRISIAVNPDRDGSPRGSLIPQMTPGAIAGVAVTAPSQ